MPSKKKTNSNSNKKRKTRKKKDEQINETITTTSHKITEYFQVRKSSRRCQSDIEKERKAFIEKAILNQHEDGLEVKQVPDKGRGVFAVKEFKKGDFIVEYAGELISYKEAKCREESYSCSVGCYMYYFEFKNRKYCIDATAESGRLGRLLNHSKTTSNCHTKLYEIDSGPVLILLASRDIRIDEELTYDYGDRSKFSLASHPWLLN